MFRVTILGSGASIPSVKRGLSAISIKQRGVYLFDCGEGTQRQMMKYKVGYGNVKAVFISHLHTDHFLGLVGLIETFRLTGRTEPLLIFGPEGTKGMFREDPFIRVEEISDGFTFKTADFTVSAIRNNHSRNSFGFLIEQNKRRKFDEKKANALGIRGRLFSDIEKNGELVIKGKTIALDDISALVSGKKIVYSGDTMPCGGIEEASKDADLLIHEGTFRSNEKEDALEKKHSTIGEAAQLAKNANAKKLIITHISTRYTDVKELEKEARGVFRESYIAQDGMDIIV
jgi:ribonuclease Z